MPTAGLQFEMERRVIIFTRNTTMPDNTLLGYEGNPNEVDAGNSDGEFLLYNSPQGTHYQEIARSSNNMWIKTGLPNTWEKLEAGGGSEEPEIAEPYVEVFAQENLGGHRVITFEGVYADQENLDSMYKIAGITKNASNINTYAKAYYSGIITEPSWNWEMGKIIVLRDNGHMTQDIPNNDGYIVSLGYPKSSNSMFVNIQMPIRMNF